MIEVACQCDDLPAHDHFMGHALQDYGGYEAIGPIYDREDVGRVWVDWKAVAHALSDALVPTSNGPIGPESAG